MATIGEVEAAFQRMVDFVAYDLVRRLKACPGGLDEWTPDRFSNLVGEATDATLPRDAFDDCRHQAIFTAVWGPFDWWWNANKGSLFEWADSHRGWHHENEGTFRATADYFNRELISRFDSYERLVSIVRGDDDSSGLSGPTKRRNKAAKRAHYMRRAGYEREPEASGPHPGQLPGGRSGYLLGLSGSDDLPRHQRANVLPLLMGGPLVLYFTRDPLRVAVVYQSTREFDEVPGVKRGSIYHQARYYVVPDDTVVMPSQMAFNMIEVNAAGNRIWGSTYDWREMLTEDYGRYPYSLPTGRLADMVRRSLQARGVE